jgi:hypothetical protein
MEDLDDFRERVFAHVVVGEVKKSMATITRLCQKAGCETADVVLALVQGKLRSAVVESNREGKIGALRFNLEEASDCLLRERRTLSEVAGAAVIDQREAAAHMAVKANTIPYLISLGLLESTAVKNQVNNRLQTVVTVASMTDFRKQYLRVSEVAALYETHSITILDRFAKIGVRPIYDDCGTNVSRFFRRSEVENAMFSIPKIMRK